MQKNFSDVMPVLARHNGEWTGDYIYFSAQGEILDRHKSHLICRITGGENTHTINKILTHGTMVGPRNLSSTQPANRLEYGLILIVYKGLVGK